MCTFISFVRSTEAAWICFPKGMWCLFVPERVRGVQDVRVISYARVKGHVSVIIDLIDMSDLALA